MTLGELYEWARALELPPGARDRARRVGPALVHRLGLMVRVGLGYLGIDRTVRTLSEGSGG